jgi:hypothetical protein
METNGVLFWTRKWTFRFHKILGNYWVFAQRTASQEVLCSIELVCLYLISSRQMSICFSYHIFSYAQPCAHYWINVLYTKCRFLPVTAVVMETSPCLHLLRHVPSAPHNRDLQNYSTGHFLTEPLFMVVGSMQSSCIALTWRSGRQHVRCLAQKRWERVRYWSRASCRGRICSRACCGSSAYSRTQLAAHLL